MGGWAKDPKLKELGRVALAALESDVEGETPIILPGQNVVDHMPG